MLLSLERKSQKHEGLGEVGTFLPGDGGLAFDLPNVKLLSLEGLAGL